MATSRLLPVVVIGPWRNCWVTAATLTPMPLFWPLAEPTALATASANSAREDLKPVVLALAMLWPITSRFLLAAFRPERPCWNPMVCSCDVFGWMVRGSVHGLDGGVGDVGAVVQLQRQLAVGGACGEHRMGRQRGRGHDRVGIRGLHRVAQLAGVARVLAAVPGEVVAASGAAAQLDGVHQLAAGGGDLHLHVGGRAFEVEGSRIGLFLAHADRKSVV